MPTSTCIRVPPPQTYQVELAYSGEEEAGRFATAARAISPGELVLSALPYVLVFNPSEFVSALYLTATASHSADVASSPARSSEASTASKKKVKKASAPSAQTSSSAWQSESGAEVGAVFTTCPTWCSGCLSPIEAGARVVNAAALRDVALSLSIEQEDTEAALADMAAHEAQSGAGALPKDSEESGEKGKKTLKKPVKSGKMRKDSAVELRQRLNEAALVRREALLYTHRQRAQSDAFATALNDYESWWREAGSSSPTAVDGAGTGTTTEMASCDAARAVVGCTGCGVMVYCSRTCWESTHRAQHVESGECAVLRRVYPRIMKIYYSMSGGSNNGNNGSAQGVMLPGLAEVQQWARATGEEKSLEAQSMLLAAIVFSRAVKEGRSAHWWQSLAPSSLDSSPSSASDPCCAPSLGEPSAALPLPENAAAVRIAASHCHTQSQSQAASSAAPSLASGTAVLTDSALVPREVVAIQETRQKLGLTGAVELMDDVAASPFVATHATAALRESPHTHIQNGGMKGADRLAPAVLPTLAPRQHLVTPGHLFYGGPHTQWPASNTAPAAAQTETPSLSHYQQDLVMPSYGDMASMVTNLSVLSKDRRAVFSSYYRRFVKHVLPWLPVFDVRTGASSSSSVSYSQAMAAALHPGQREGALPKLDFDPSRYTLPENAFLQLCAAAQCNSFGVYSQADRCVAFAVYPEASYFNHSCYPNLCRVMRNGARSASFYALRPIPRGEPLTICYTDIQEQNTAERRRNLLHTYRFFCRCQRCVGNVAVTVRGHEGDTIGEIGLCTACPVRGYLRPLPPPDLYPSAALAHVCGAPAKDGVGAALSSELPHWTREAVMSTCCTVCGRVYQSA